ncbi:alpha/beta hydrolase [Paenibacillus marinisediminis]
MNLLAVGIDALIMLVVLVMLAIWVLAVKSQSPSRKPIVGEPKHKYEAVTFKGRVNLQGWLIWPATMEGKPSPAIVVSHGWSSNRSRVLRYADRLNEAGYAVLVYDVSNHGESEAIKAASALMFRDDLQAAVAYLRSRADIDAEKIGVLGHSLGGFGALLALDEGIPVRAIVTDSMPSKPFTMISAELKRRKMPVFPLAWLIPRIWLLRAHIPKSAYDELDLAVTLMRNEQRGDAKIPVLMSHSRGDTFIPPSELTSTLDKLNYSQPHVLVDTPGHSSSEQDERFWKAVLPFYQEHVHHVQLD